MSENHELRITIDAGAAERGSRQFVAAVEAVKRSVRDLERDSTGTFKKLAQNLKQAEQASKVKLGGVDKSALNSLEKYSRLQQEALRATMATRKETASLSKVVQALSEAYDHGRHNVEAMNKALLQSNAHLKRQIQLASQARSAVRQIRAAPGIETSVSPRMQAGARDSGASVAGTQKVNKELERSESLQNRITRAIDNQRAATASLMAQLAKVGGVAEIERLEKAFDRFRSSLSASTADAKTLDNAQTKLNHVQKTMKVTLTRLNAELTAQREDLKAAATAAREQAKAFDALTRAANAHARAQATQTKEAERLERVQTSTSKAMRNAELTTARLVERLRSFGDTSGINRINRALQQFQKEVASGIHTQQALRNAQSGFEAAANKAAVALVRQEGAHRRTTKEANEHARAERRVRDEAIQIERQMRSLAGATNATGQAWHRATGNLRGMENAFNATYQAGTLFRNLLGALTLGTFIRSVYDAGNSLQQFMVTMEVATGDIRGSMENALFIDDLTSNFGTNLRTAREDFAKFAVAAELAGVSSQQSQEIFESVSMALSVMGRGAEDQRLAFLALEQMMSKGTVSSEELRRQLGERLPGAVNMMADALSVTTAELQDMLKAGEISSADALPKFAREVQKNFGPGLQSSLSRASRNIGTFMNEIEKVLSEVANSGFMDTLAVEFQQLTQLMRTDYVREFAQEMGMQLSRAAQIAGDAMGWLVDNADLARRAVTALLAGFVVTKVAHFANFFVTAAQQLAAFAAASRGTKTANDLTSLSTDNYTKALGRNTSAVGLNATAQAGLTTALTSVQQQQALRAAFLGTATANIDKAGKAATGAARGIAGMAGTLGVLSRGLTVVAPVIGIVTTALLMFPGIMDMFSESVVDADAEVQRAIKRSGVAFEDLGETLGNFGRNTVFNSLAADIDALTNSVRDLNKASETSFASVYAIAMADKGGATIGDGLIDKLSRGSMDLVGGLELNAVAEQWNKMDESAKKAAHGIIDSIIAMKNNMKSATDVHAELAAAMRTNPSGRGYFQMLESGLRDYMQAERALIAQRDKMVVMTGSTADKDLKGLTDLGAAFLKGDGDEADMKAYTDQLKKLRETYAELPAVMANVTEADRLFRESVEEGRSAFEFKSGAQGLYATTVDDVQKATLAQQKANAQSAEVNATIKEQIRLLNLRNEANAWWTRTPGYMMSNDDRVRAQPDVDSSAVAATEGLFKQFENTAAVKVADADLSDLLNTMSRFSPEMSKLVASTEEQFSALREGDQTYRNLDAIIQQMAANNPQLASSLDLIRMSVAALARTQDEGAMTAYDLRQRLMEYAQKLPDDAAQSLLDAADNLNASGLALAAANRQMADAEKGANDLDSAAEELRKTLESIRALGKGIVEEAMGDIADVDFDTELSKMAPWLREGAEIWRDEKAKLDAALKAGFAQYENDPAKIAEVTKEYEAQIAALREVVALRNAAEKRQFDTKTWEDGQRELDKLAKEAEKAKDKIRDLYQEVADFGQGIKDNNVALQLYVTGQARTREGAELLARAMATGNKELIASARNMLLASDAAAVYAEHLEKIADLKDERKEYAQGLLEEYHALSLLSSGMAKTTEAADMMARAMMTGDAQTIAQTKALLGMADAMQKAMERMQAIQDVKDAIKDMGKSLFEQNLSLQLLIEGQAKTTDHAELLAQAMMTGDEATIRQTRAFLEQAEAAELLGKKLKILASDPVKEWVNSVPTWKEAGDQIERDVFESLSNEIADFIKTGEFSFESLAESILSSVADIVADMATRELMNLFGVVNADGTSNVRLGDRLQGQFGYSKGSVFDPANGGMPTASSTDMLTQGEKDGYVYTEAMTQAGQSAAQAMQQALQQGGQGSAAELKAAIEQATQQAKPVLSSGVTEGADTGKISLQSGLVDGSKSGASILQQALDGAFRNGAQTLAQAMNQFTPQSLGYGQGWTPTGGGFGSGLSGAPYQLSNPGAGAASSLMGRSYGSMKNNPAMIQAIVDTANSIGMKPTTLMSIIGYESAGTFDPGVRGGAGGNYQGLIQFGPEERRKYGVTSDPMSQLGANGAIANFFKDRGWNPGLDNADARAYATVNAGNPWALGASDAANGGRPGSAQYKWESDPVMLQHRANAEATLAKFNTTAQSATSNLSGYSNLMSGTASDTMLTFGDNIAKAAPQVGTFATNLGEANPQFSDLASNIGRAGASFDFSTMGPNRPNMPNVDLLQALENAAVKTFGNGATIQVTSGMGEYGSPRHRGGHAADFQLIDPNGNVVPIDSSMGKQFAINAGASGITGLGAGHEYMPGNTWHMDNYPTSQYSSNMGQYWGSVGSMYGPDFVAAQQGMGGGMGGGVDFTQQMIQGGQQAGQAIHQSMVQAGQSAGSTVQQQISTGGAQMGMQATTSLTTGGAMAGSQMGSQINSGGGTAATQMRSAIEAGGASAAQQMGAAAGGGGGGGGGLLGGLFGGGSGGMGGIWGMALSAGLGMLPQLFAGKNKDDDDDKNEYTIVLPDEDSTGTVVSYAQGTANTSGIPAMLHQNEAVIPLTGNRKVPVELEDGAGGRGGSVVNQTFNISTPDADSFRKSQKQIAAGAAYSGQKAMKSNG